MTQFADQLASSNHETGEPFELRPYQQHIISELYKLLRQGTKRILGDRANGFRQNKWHHRARTGKLYAKVVELHRRYWLDVAAGIAFWYGVPVKPQQRLKLKSELIHRWRSLVRIRRVATNRHIPVNFIWALANF